MRRAGWSDRAPVAADLAALVVVARLIIRGANVAWGGRPRGGHASYVLQWIDGFRRLGHEVLYHDILDGTPAVARAFDQVLSSWRDVPIVAGLLPSGETLRGCSVREVERFAERADAMFTLGAPYTKDVEPWLESVHPRVLIEQDPGFAHLWAAKASPDEVFGRHDAYYTVGANVASGRSGAPSHDIAWRHVWNPVVLDRWNEAPSTPEGRFTTVASLWSQKYQEFDGQVWGPKVEQLEQFLHVPGQVEETLEIAAEPGAGREAVGRLESHGWHVVDAGVVVGDVDRYREYIWSSAAEFTCVKGLYAGTNSGWFGDRSACYLAAGKPVVMQDTGLDGILPSGRGLHLVTTAEEAVDAIRRVRRSYADESAAARATAAAYFDSGLVLRRLLNEVGVI